MSVELRNTLGNGHNGLKPSQLAGAEYGAGARNLNSYDQGNTFDTPVASVEAVRIPS